MRTKNWGQSHISATLQPFAPPSPGLRTGDNMAVRLPAKIGVRVLFPLEPCTPAAWSALPAPLAAKGNKTGSESHFCIPQSYLTGARSERLGKSETAVSCALWCALSALPPRMAKRRWPQRPAVPPQCSLCRQPHRPSAWAADIPHLPHTVTTLVFPLSRSKKRRHRTPSLWSGERSDDACGHRLMHNQAIWYTIKH